MPVAINYQRLMSACGVAMLSSTAIGANDKPNILIIRDDDIGGFNLDRVMEAVTKGAGDR